MTTINSILTKEHSFWWELTNKLNCLFSNGKEDPVVMINSVLLVENDTISNFLSEDILNQMDIHNVKAVTNGRLAIDHLSEELCPDLILLDLNMPVMDGFEFLETKNAQRLCPEVKVAVLTSSIRPVDRKKISEYKEVISYIEKPLTRQKVENLLMDFPESE